MFKKTCQRLYSSLHKQVIEQSLEESDPVLFKLLKQEQIRQKESICLIPSENFTSKAVMQSLGSVFQNKYSEGYPGKRYYGGNEIIDQVEILCQQRALQSFGLSPEEWGVNVQVLSGSPANLCAYGAIMKPHDRMMGLDLPSGGHLSHGYQTPTKKISAVSTYYENFPYQVDSNGFLNYDEIEKTALAYRPKVIVGGGSAYARNWDYKRLREITDKIGAYFLFDMAHISGLVSAGVVPSPFEHSDIVTTTTHKSLRGPRGAMIFYRLGERQVGKKKMKYSLDTDINFSVFPGHQGGPHNHTIAALATALGQTQSEEFKEYQRGVIINAQAMATEFIRLGYDIVTGGTDTHLLLLDLTKTGTDGARVERILELVNIAANKNTIPGDKSALVPHGLRVGTPAMTTRNCNPNNFVEICGLIDEAVKITLDIATKVDGKKFSDFKAFVGDGREIEAVQNLKAKVRDFAIRFPLVI